jgi:hypothetical protein
MSENLLAAETSPYLLQHKDNPVHWRPWGSEALAEARRLDRPILLSVGYAACHWCHVMAHESFEKRATAELMNALFVNIKVDREERPDVDAIYQSALAMLGEHGGWPLTMFLTPAGEPFWGGTYFPPTARYGRPAFSDVLQQVAQVYDTDRERVTKNVAALRDGLARMAAPKPGAGITRATLDDAATAALRLIDPFRGGTAGAPKFPQPLLFRFLWRTYLRTRSGLFRDAVTLTLDAMAAGGIYDHLAGGFARYATDADWLVPHFEKMLYDNALIVELMTEVWQELKTPVYAQRVRETIDWAVSELRVDSPTGAGFAFAGAQDADSEGEEGKYYVWTEAEVDAALGDDAALFKRVYDVTARGNWEGRTILNRSRSAEPLTDAVEATLAQARSRLLAVRRRRVPPGRDDKVLADWNGLMIAALAKAAVAFDHAPWLTAAAGCFAFVSEHMQAGDRLHHTWCAGRARHPAVLDDYANMARAALVLFEVTGERPYLDRAVHWVAIAGRDYWDEAGGGYFLTAADTGDVIVRAKTVADNATPSGNGTMLEVLARLHVLTGDDAYRQRAETLARLFSDDNTQYLLSIPGLLSNAALLAEAVQIVIVGDPDDAAAARLRRVAFEAPAGNRILMQLAPGETLPAGHPAAGKVPSDGRAVAYVCVGTTCGLPMTEPSDLRHALASV